MTNYNIVFGATCQGGADGSAGAAEAADLARLRSARQYNCVITKDGN